MTRKRIAGLVIVVWAEWLATGAAQDQRPSVFRSNIDVVRVDVLAVDKGKPIQGLTINDFEVKDNGVLQNVDLATTAGYVSLAIALDTQASRWPEANRELLNASGLLVDALHPNDLAWVLTFAQEFALRAGPTSDKAVLHRALDGIKYGSAKCLWDALFAGVTLVSDYDGRATVVVFSDGQENTRKPGWLDEKHTVEALKRGDVMVNAVQPRSVVVSPTSLERVARTTGGVVLEAEKNSHLAEQFTTLLDEFRLSYILTFTPKGVSHDGSWHKLSVKLKNHSGKVTAREGYYSGMR